MLVEALTVTAVVAGFYMAWNIGANDVANAFGTSVGSGAITMRRALLLAAVFEFSGAFFAGSHVTKTIRGEIVSPEMFAGNTQLFAVGMVAALIASSVWLNVATFFGQPVSTTHAIIGAVIGFGVSVVNVHCVRWHKLGHIAASWFISPLVGAAISFAVYYGLRRFVLHSRAPVSRARHFVPLGLAAMSCVMLYSILQGAYPRFFHIERAEACWIAALTALVVGNVAGVVVWAVMRRRCLPGGDLSRQAERVEGFFARLQILDACYLSFAHGANDVANAVGPVVGVVQGIRGTVSGAAAVPAWILAFGGVGIVVGLATYGYKVIEAVGTKITEVTPTRGFAAEFSTATTVLVCSLLGLPISTTFVLVGAVMGVGFARGLSSIDGRVVRRIFASWVITIPVSAALSAVLCRVLMALFGVGELGAAP
ncbi:MAG: inorganic phosphate transporter [Lentisphaerae bacterium]|nr:inorganic phosphate transporter [Lentisphaerota bacterium]